MEDEEGEVNVGDRYTLNHQSGKISGNSLYRKVPCDVTLDGMRLRVVSEIEGRETLTFAGMLNPSYTEAKGTFESVWRHADPAVEDSRETYPARLVRIAEDQLKAEKLEQELRDKRFAEAKSIFEAIKRFAARNEGKFPASLAQLTPDDLPDRSLVASQPGRGMTYTGGAMLTRIEAIAEIEREFKGKDKSTESIIEYERKLREVWGGELPFQTTVLRIEYDDPPLAIDIVSSGAERSSDQGETQSPGSDPIPTESLRELEFNNLKRLMLACKMFSNENEDHLPGGWLMLYPEYITDLRLLESPWAPEGTVSYEFLFPGESEKQMVEYAEELFKSGSLHVADVSLAYGALPAILSRDNLPAEPGLPPARAVAFLDGHVEAVPLAEWDTRIAPFLR